jgi:hypothetical protein
VPTNSAENVREFYRKQGKQREQARILQLIESMPFLWMGDVQLIYTSKDRVIEKIKEDN